MKALIPHVETVTAAGRFPFCSPSAGIIIPISNSASAPILGKNYDSIHDPVLEYL